MQRVPTDTGESYERRVLRAVALTRPAAVFIAIAGLTMRLRPIGQSMWSLLPSYVRAARSSTLPELIATLAPMNYWDGVESPVPHSATVSSVNIHMAGIDTNTTRR